MRSTLVPLLALLALAIPAAAARAEDPPAADPGRLALATEHVVVFKDGYALFVKTGRATPDAEGRVFTEDVPGGAVLGCFWALSEDRRVLGMRSAWDERREVRERERPCLTALDLLRANVGQEVTLGLTRAGDADVTAKVVEVLESEPTREEPDAASAAVGETPIRLVRNRWEPAGPDASAPARAGRTAREIVPVGGSFVVLERAGKGRLVMPVAEVRTVSGAALVTTIKRREEVVTRAKRLSIDLGRAAAGKPSTVRLLYFAEGVRWIPTYRVEGDLAKDARVALQGEVMNEAEAIVDASVDLVVGVPSFRFKDVASPLSLEQALRSTLRSAAPQLASQMMSNSYYRSGGRDDEAGPPSALDAAPELAREAHQDLFTYGVGKATLAKGSRATFPLWQSTVPLRHLYTMDLHVVREYRSGDYVCRSARETPASAARPSRAGTNLVWHEVELRNGSDVPWTTGAALLLQGDVPLGQDLLPYTSPGASSLLPVTVAVDLQGRWAEREVARQPNAISWSGTTYSLVRKKGTVTLVNRRKEPSAVRVSVSLGGHVEEASDGGTTTINDLWAEDWNGNPYPVNNHSDVVWEVTLRPGETKTLDATFSFYVT